MDDRRIRHPDTHRVMVWHITIIKVYDASTKVVDCHSENIVILT